MTVRRGFSLVEILIAIAVIVVLVGMITVGFRAFGNKGRSDVTQTALENVKGLMAEYQAQTKAPFAAAGPLAAPAGPMADAANRVDKAVSQTAGQLARLSRVKAAADMLAKMPTGTVTTWGALTKDASPAAVTDIWSNASMPYVPGMRLRRNIGGVDKFFVCLSKHISSASNGPPSANYWSEELNPASSDVRPVILDGWGNPILFVPAGGLHGTDAAPGIMTLNGVQRAAVTGTPAGALGPVQSPTQNPFAVSAGPDGSFLTADDNVFSFGPVSK